MNIVLDIRFHISPYISWIKQRFDPKNLRSVCSLICCVRYNWWCLPSTPNTLINICKWYLPMWDQSVFECEWVSVPLLKQGSGEGKAHPKMDQPNFHRHLTSYHWKPRTKAGPRPPSEPYRPLLTSNSPQRGRRKIDMMYKYKYKVQHLNITTIISVKETSLPSCLSSWWWEQWSKREPSWEKWSNRMFVTRQAIISGSLSSGKIEQKPKWYQLW